MSKKGLKKYNLITLIKPLYSLAGWDQKLDDLVNSIKEGTFRLEHQNEGFPKIKILSFKIKQSHCEDVATTITFSLLSEQGFPYKEGDTLVFEDWADWLSSMTLEVYEKENTYKRRRQELGVF